MAVMCGSSESRLCENQKDETFGRVRPVADWHAVEPRRKIATEVVTDDVTATFCKKKLRCAFFTFPRPSPSCSQTVSCSFLLSLPHASVRDHLCIAYSSPTALRPVLNSLARASTLVLTEANSSSNRHCFLIDHTLAAQRSLS